MTHPSVTGVTLCFVPFFVSVIFVVALGYSKCDALRGLVEPPIPFEQRNSELPVQAIAEAVRGRVSHTQMEHASCVRKEVRCACGALT